MSRVTTSHSHLPPQWVEESMRTEDGRKEIVRRCQMILQHDVTLSPELRENCRKLIERAQHTSRAHAPRNFEPFEIAGYYLG